MGLIFPGRSGVHFTFERFKSADSEKQFIGIIAAVLLHLIVVEIFCLLSGSQATSVIIVPNGRLYKGNIV